MNYLALGDSMSIDQYTCTSGGGAVNQFARLVNADVLEDHTYDGCTTAGVLDELTRVTIQPDIITITAGGNDLILAAENKDNRREAVFSLAQPQNANYLLENLDEIFIQVARYRCSVILNTVYDPTDGDDTLLASLGFAPDFRVTYEQVNNHIRQLAQQHGYLLADLAFIFRGHGMTALDSWLTLQIEPNLAGATAIANCWYTRWLP
ncbi:MAG TPA: SGNH/GDSL hydrolase family protein [Armatimonadota bacterium]|jgi:lysophospholipase L1-like esterase